MQTIKDLLNKIKWNNREKEEDYSIVYLDRVENKKKEIRYINIKSIDGNFMIFQHGLYDVHVPLHRIREVKKNNKVVWKRL